MNASEFVRVYSQRAPRIMWFLGAGASAAAGIPTAGQMTWEFKRAIYCTDRRVSVAAYSNLNDPLVRARIQSHFDDQAGYPTAGSDDEYAFYFERMYSSEVDRRSYIDQKVAAGTPSYGSIGLAALLKMDLARIVWTTNFDRIVEDAIVQVYGTTSRLVVATPDGPHLANQALSHEQWPLVGKLHGDFQSERLRNVRDELQTQDAELRRALLRSCERFGLAVVGYSGRDRSVMDVLRKAIDDGRGFPGGLFWFHRSGSEVSKQVTEIITEAQEAGVDAHLVETETFDELISDIIRYVPNVPTEIMRHLDTRRRRVSEVPPPPKGGGWPVLRTNALPILSYPTVARRVACEIGGTAEVHKAVRQSGANIIATRRNVGVIAFGSDAEVRRAFEGYSINEFDLHSIEASRLRYESSEQGLLREALVKALARERPIIAKRIRRTFFVIADREQSAHGLLRLLSQAVRNVCGTVPGTSLQWSEAAALSLDYRHGHLWLVLEPTIWVDRSTEESDSRRVREFVKKRLEKRYNRQWNTILEAWIYVFTKGQDQSELRTFGISEVMPVKFCKSVAG